MHTTTSTTTTTTTTTTSTTTSLSYPHKLQGDGSLIASADFYNPALAVWEPILDRWHPSLSLSTWQTGQSGAGTVVKGAM